jgi:hypothetical protein
MILTVFIPDRVYRHFQNFPDPRKAVEAAVLKHVEDWEAARRDPTMIPESPSSRGH